MKYLKKYTENRISIFNPEWSKLLPEQLIIVTENGEFTLSRESKLSDTGHPIDISNLMNCLQIIYIQHTQQEKDGDVNADGEPDYMCIDITLVKDNNGQEANPDTLKLNVDITYGDHMQYSFTIDKSGVNVHHYTGKNSLYDPETFWGFSDESLEKLVEFFNRFGFDTTIDDYKFIDKDPDSYQYEKPIHKEKDLDSMIKVDNQEIIDLKGGDKISHWHGKKKVSTFESFVNENYNRVVGFRYSKPTLGFLIKCYYINGEEGNLTTENVETALSKVFDLTYQNIKLDQEFGTILLDENVELEVDGKLSFEVFVYTERELESIIEEFAKKLYAISDVKCVDFGSKELKSNYIK